MDLPRLLLRFILGKKLIVTQPSRRCFVHKHRCLTSASTVFSVPTSFQVTKLDDSETSVSPVPSKVGADSKSRPKDPVKGKISDLEVKNVNFDRGSIDDEGLALLWFSVITYVLVLVAINIGGSSFFNP